NHLVEVERKSNGTNVDLRVEYFYDAQGNRVEELVDPDGDGSASGTVTKFVLDGWNPAKPAPIGLENFDVLADLAGDGSLLTRYLWGDNVDQLLARVDYLNPSDGAITYWYLNDWLGSIREIIDNTGTIRDSLSYDGFGNVTSETTPSVTGRYQWTGREK